MLLNEMLRTTGSAVSGLGAGRCSASTAWGRVPGAPGPTLKLIGPVTFCSTRLEKDMFSNRDPRSAWNLIGHPYTSWSRHLETVMFSAKPPPKRKTDQRVLK